MGTAPKFYLVEASVLPQILHQVVEATKLLENGKAQTIGDAAAKAGISRSAYYKYKDKVSPFYEMKKDAVITLYAILRDEPGVLSSLLNAFAKAGINVLTINQNIPTSGIANITMSVEIRDIKMKLERILEKVGSQDGIVRIGVMARE